MQVIFWNNCLCSFATFCSHVKNIRGQPCKWRQRAKGSTQVEVAGKQNSADCRKGILNHLRVFILRKTTGKSPLACGQELALEENRGLPNIEQQNNEVRTKSAPWRALSVQRPAVPRRSKATDRWSGYSWKKQATFGGRRDPSPHPRAAAAAVRPPEEFLVSGQRLTQPGYTPTFVIGHSKFCGSAVLFCPVLFHWK